MLREEKDKHNKESNGDKYGVITNTHALNLINPQ
jgi:hypothetical protein